MCVCALCLSRRPRSSEEGETSQQAPRGQPDGPPGSLAAFSRSYNASANAIRSRTYTPPSRLVTWASDKKEKDVCLDIADVVSFNSYPAW